MKDEVCRTHMRFNGLEFDGKVPVINTDTREKKIVIFMDAADVGSLKIGICQDCQDRLPFMKNDGSPSTEEDWA